MRGTLNTLLLLALAAAAAAAGCSGANGTRAGATTSAGTRASTDAPPASDEAASAPEASAHAAPRAPGPLTRPEAEALVARGLGSFLARVTLSPEFDAGGRFVGFRLDAAQDLADWNAAGADVRVGDVILRVNGIRIERPEQALWAFERLRIAEAIEVDLLRGGQPVRVQSPIVAGPTASR